jgi:hypothetical protein
MLWTVCVCVCGGGVCVYVWKFYIDFIRTLKILNFLFEGLFKLREFFEKKST